MQLTTWDTLRFSFVVLCVLASLLSTVGRSQGRGSQSQASGAEDRERMLVRGKQLFVERCARCHDERGDKPLKRGPPLSERNLSDQDIARFVSGRLKDAPDEEKHAVILYVSSFMKRK
jgi:mono/diheme cytochrome c family protein